MLLDNGFTALDQAAWSTVHEYRTGRQQGAAALAPLVGKSPATLSNEVNPAVITHKLGLTDAVVLQHATGNPSILQAMAQTLHHVAIALPDFTPIGDVALLDKFLEWQTSLGVTCHVIQNALQGSAVTPSELDNIRARAQDHMRVFFEFLSRMETLVEGER